MTNIVNINSKIRAVQCFKVTDIIIKVKTTVLKCEYKLVELHVYLLAILHKKCHTDRVSMHIQS